MRLDPRSNDRLTGILPFAFAIAVAWAGCGDGSVRSSTGGTGGNGVGGAGGLGGPPATAAMPVLTFASVKAFRFVWTDVSDATHYKLFEDPDGASGFSNVGSDIAQGNQTVDHIVPLYARINAQYLLQSCNDAGCTDSESLSVGAELGASIGYFKASNADGGDDFGDAVSLSADGDTLAVGAPFEGSNAGGVNGDQRDNSAGSAGAVYVFARSGGTWSQEAYLKASNPEGSDFFGDALSLNAEGDTLAVGAVGEDSNATGVNGNQADNSASRAGAAYVFARSGGTWSQAAYLKASNPETVDFFGFAVSLSAEGDTLAVGAVGEDSNATGVSGDQEDNSALSAGAVYVFARSGGTWSQAAYLKASNPEQSDEFGGAVSLSAEGDTLVVGARGEDSNAGGVNGDQADNSAASAGAVYVFARSGGTWSQAAYLKASNAESADQFGRAVSLSGSGDTLAVGALGEASNAAGVNGNQADNSALAAGAVYVFARSGGTWSQAAYLKASNPEAGDVFGLGLSLSGSGDTLAVGATREASNATGVNGDQADNSVLDAGAVYVFARDGGTWSQEAYLKASNTEEGDRFGSAVGLSAGGDTLAVGATREASNATGVNGDQADNSALDAGAVYLY